MKRQVKFNPKIQKVRELDEYDKNLQKILWLILGIYGLSLILPAFGWVNHKSEVANMELGWQVLVYDLPLGWLYVFFGGLGGLAVYANLVFARITVSLYAGKEISYIHNTLLMIFLALLSFVVVEPSGGALGDAGSTDWHDNDIVHVWSYGAYCWFFALFATAYVVIARSINPEKLFHIRNFIISFIAVLTLLLGVQYYRYAKANDVEKERYFHKKVILTTVKMSGVEYNPPQKSGIVLNKDDVIQIKNPVELDKSFIKRVQDDKNLWVIYNSRHQLAEILPKMQVDYIYENNKNHHKISDENGNVLWQTDDETFAREYHQDVQEFFSILEPPKLANSQDEFFVNNIQKEKFSPSAQCQFEIIETKYDSDNLYDGDYFGLYGKKFYIKLEKGNISEYQLWCGKNYDILIKPKEYDREMSAILFDKRLKQPVAQFFWVYTDIVGIPRDFNGHKIVQAKEALSSDKKIEELQIKWMHINGKGLYDSDKEDIIDKPSDNPNKKSDPIILGKVGQEYVLLLDVR